MCIIYNTIGALSHIDSHLANNNIDDFNSISELINFEQEYPFLKEQIISKHTLFVQKEKQELEEDIQKLTEKTLINKFESSQKLEQKLQTLNSNVEMLFLPNSTFTTILKDLVLNIIVWVKIWSVPIITRVQLFSSTRQLNKLLLQKNIRYTKISSNFEEAVNNSASSELQHLSKKTSIIKELNSYIYGAVGEQKVEGELSKLSDDYILINDFTCSFHPSIFNSKSKEYIKTVQIDHILVSPSGVFLIETKNWSEKSLKNTDFRSPVQQVLRANYALYKILERNNLKSHHWGKLKIPIINIITFIHHKPMEEFQFVKILSLDELVKYMTYFPPCFSKEDVQNIANYLLKNCDTKNKFCRLNI